MRARRFKHVLIFALYIFVFFVSFVLSQPQVVVTPSAFFNPNRHQKNLVQVLSTPPQDDPQLPPDLPSSSPPSSSPLAGSSLISTNLILVSTLDGSIHGIDRFKCKIIWTMRGGPDSQLIRTNSASAFRGAASSAAEKRGAKAERSTFDEKFTEEWKAETGLQYSGMDEPEDSEPSVSDEDVVYIVEPKGDGELYMYIKGKPLQKLNLSVKQLASMSPFYADGTVYISSKSTKLIAIDPNDGRLLQRFGNDGADESLILGKKDLPQDVIFLGKNEYKVSIYHNNMLKWNVTYNEYVPNTLDANFDLPSFPSSLYFAPDATGAITAINIEDGELAWTIEMKFPAVSTFEVYYRPDGGFVIKQQPTPLIPNKGALGRKLDQLERRTTAYIGQISGTFYAMSTDSFPLMRMARWANGRDSTGGRLPGIGQGAWPEDDYDDDDDDDGREPARCSLGSPHFASCLEGQHNIDIVGPRGYIESAEAVKRRKGLEEAAALTNNPTQRPPRKTIPEPSRFLEEGPGRFWKTYLLLASVVVYYYRGRIRELYNARIEPVLEPAIQPYLVRIKSHLERAGIVAMTREVIDPSKLDEVFGEKGKKEGKRKKKGVNKVATGSGSGGSNSGSSKKEGEEEQDGVIGKTVKFKEEFVEKENEAKAETEAGKSEEALPAAGPTKLNSLCVTDTILGYGSHGTVVYKGTFDGRDVAVKRLLLDFYDVAYHEVTLLEESDDHPNVIRYYCKEEANRFLYIALELCQASLYDAIEHGSSSPHAHLLETVHPARVLYQIIAGLRHLHSLKIVHRDIKPQNILLAPVKPHHRSSQHGQRTQLPGGGTIRVMISDFGLCKKLEADQSSFHNTTASAAGTIGWRAPELLSQTLEEPEENAVFIDSTNLSTLGFTTVSTSSSNHSSSLAAPVRITKAIDIFSAGCVFYYVLSGGEHPFGDKFSREINIIKGMYSLDRLSGMGEDGVEARDLIERMIAREPRNRPDAETVLLHPYFWTPAQRLAFLQDASDRFEIENRDPPSPLIQHLECNAHEIIGPDWYRRIDRVLVNDLRKFRKYDGRMIRDLLRALRNKKHHWQDLAEPLKRALGQPPDEYLFYFTSRFPRLFLHTYYIIAQDDRLRTEHMFRHYFEVPHTLR